MEITARHGHHFEAFSNAILAGDTREAAGVISEAHHAGMDAHKIYLEILAPSLLKVGELYHKNSISITEEHIATQMVADQMSVLRVFREPRYKVGRSVLCCTPPGERHGLACRMLADLFWFEGWEVLAPGVDVPHDDLCALAKKKNFDFILLSVPQAESADGARRLASALVTRGYENKILAGGRAVGALGKVKGVHSLTGGIESALQTAYALLGDTADEMALAQYLNELGQRISLRRKELSLNQLDLSERAKIDRGYLSAVENGKENCTIGVLSRIARALEIGVEALLAGRA